MQTHNKAVLFLLLLNIVNLQMPISLDNIDYFLQHIQKDKNAFLDEFKKAEERAGHIKRSVGPKGFCVDGQSYIRVLFSHYNNLTRKYRKEMRETEKKIRTHQILKYQNKPSPYGEKEISEKGFYLTLYSSTLKNRMNFKEKLDNVRKESRLIAGTSLKLYRFYKNRREQILREKVEFLDSLEYMLNAQKKLHARSSGKGASIIIDDIDEKIEDLNKELILKQKESDIVYRDASGYICHIERSEDICTAIRLKLTVLEWGKDYLSRLNELKLESDLSNTSEILRGESQNNHLIMYDCVEPNRENEVLSMDNQENNLIVYEEGSSSAKSRYVDGNEFLEVHNEEPEVSMPPLKAYDKVNPIVMNRAVLKHEKIYIGNVEKYRVNVIQNFDDIYAMPEDTLGKKYIQPATPFLDKEDTLHQRRAWDNAFLGNVCASVFKFITIFAASGTSF